MPTGNGAEAGLTPGIEVRTAGDLGGVVAHLLGGEPLPIATADLRGAPAAAIPDLADVRGQEGAKRALEVAAAGGHAVLLRGAPGAGKTMLARRLRGILPALDFEESLEVTRIHGAAGQIPAGVPIVTDRPFRAPHHTASAAGLLGGGNPPMPGEISLAHRGVLFLDELPEFDRRSLEALRQVLERRRVVVARARSSCEFPAHFQFIGAANPCPCGWRASGKRDCRCDDGAIARYAARISGPLLDRIDLCVSRTAPGLARARRSRARGAQRRDPRAGRRGAGGPGAAQRGGGSPDQRGDPRRGPRRRRPRDAGGAAAARSRRRALRPLRARRAAGAEGRAHDRGPRRRGADGPARRGRGAELPGGYRPESMRAGGGVAEI